MKKSVYLILFAGLPLFFFSSCGGDDTGTYLERFLDAVYSGKRTTAFLSRMHPVLAREVRMKSLAIFSAKENLPEKVASHSLSSVSTVRRKNRKFLYGLIKEELKTGKKQYRTFLAKYRLRLPKNPRKDEKGVWILYDLIIEKGKKKKAAAALIDILEPSPKTVGMIAAIKTPVSILVFDTRLETLSTHFLKEIAIHSPGHIKLEFLNPYIERGSASAFRINNPGYIVILNGKNKLRISAQELLFRRGNTGYFQGERVIMAGIRRVLGHRNRFVYLTGHGERPVTEGKESHWSKCIDELSLCGFQVKTAPYVTASTNTDMVYCMAAPLYSPSAAEITLLKKHLAAGGTALFFLEKPVPATLRLLFDSWGIELLPHTIVDPSHKDFIKGPSWFECLIPDTALTESYTAREDFKILMGGTVGMRIKKGKKTRAAAHSFVTTSTNGWAEASYEEDKPDDVMFTPGYDIKGPIALAYSVSSAEGKGRVLVFGDSDFISDKLFTSKISNWLFFLNSLGWLTDETAFSTGLRRFNYGDIRSFL